MSYDLDVEREAGLDQAAVEAWLDSVPGVVRGSDEAYWQSGRLAVTLFAIPRSDGVLRSVGAAIVAREDATADDFTQVVEQLRHLAVRTAATLWDPQAERDLTRDDDLAPSLTEFSAYCAAVDSLH